MKPTELCTCLVVSCFCFSGESLEFLKHFLPTWTQYFSVRLNKSVERREIAGRQLCTSLAPIVQQHWEGESWSWAFLPTGYNSLWRVSSLAPLWAHYFSHGTCKTGSWRWIFHMWLLFGKPLVEKRPR